MVECRGDEVKKVKGTCDQCEAEALIDVNTHCGSSYVCCRSSAKEEMSSKRSNDQRKYLSRLQDVLSLGGEEERKVAEQVADVLVLGSRNVTVIGFREVSEGLASCS